MTATARAVSIASQRYDRSRTDFLAGITATQQSAADAIVNLYQTLGGGK